MLEKYLPSERNFIINHRYNTIIANVYRTLNIVHVIRSRRVYIVDNNKETHGDQKTHIAYSLYTLLRTRQLRRDTRINSTTRLRAIKSNLIINHVDSSDGRGNFSPLIVALCPADPDKVCQTFHISKLKLDFEAREFHPRTISIHSGIPPRAVRIDGSHREEGSASSDNTLV